VLGRRPVLWRSHGVRLWPWRSDRRPGRSCGEHSSSCVLCSSGGVPAAEASVRLAVLSLPFPPSPRDAQAMDDLDGGLADVDFEQSLGVASTAAPQGLAAQPFMGGAPALYQHGGAQRLQPPLPRAPLRAQGPGPPGWEAAAQQQQTGQYQAGAAQQFRAPPRSSSN